MDKRVHFRLGGYFLFYLMVAIGLGLVFSGLGKPFSANGEAVFLAERDETSLRVIQVLTLGVVFFSWLGFRGLAWFSLGGMVVSLGLAWFRLAGVGAEGSSGLWSMAMRTGGGGALLCAGVLVLAWLAWRGPILRWQVEREAWHNL